MRWLCIQFQMYKRGGGMGSTVSISMPGRVNQWGGCLVLNSLPWQGSNKLHVWSVLLIWKFSDFQWLANSCGNRYRFSCFQILCSSLRNILTAHSITKLSNSGNAKHFLFNASDRKFQLNGPHRNIISIRDFEIF